jgi:Binding-protein-dependent transport system inner membrane component
MGVPAMSPGLTLRGLLGRDFTWGVAFVVPYIAVSRLRRLSRRLRPVAGHRLVERPRPARGSGLINTLIYLAIALNLKVFVALPISGFFMRREWRSPRPAAELHPALGGAGHSHVHLIPLDAERPVGSDRQRDLYLVISFYGIMRMYGLADNMWSVGAVEVTFATPYAIFIFAQYGSSIPHELDGAARIDGASPPKIFFRIYLPLMAPALVASGACALLLDRNEYPYALLLLSSDQTTTCRWRWGNSSTATKRRGTT